MRKPFIAGNWKCFMTRAQAKELVKQLLKTCQDDLVEVAVCPAFTALDAVAQLLQGSKIGLGAQNVYGKSEGAFTGEVALPMLAEVGCRYVILGHSERRTLFGETDATVEGKLQAVLQSSLTPIVCIGETLAQREAEQTAAVIEAQLKGAFARVEAAHSARIVIAYEPVWAIGTGRTATPEQAQAVHAQIRGWLAKHWNTATAEQMRIQYGGSVKPENAASLLQQADIDGALVGGASLKPDSFASIVAAAKQTCAVAE